RNLLPSGRDGRVAPPIRQWRRRDLRLSKPRPAPPPDRPRGRLREVAPRRPPPQPFRHDRPDPVPALRPLPPRDLAGGAFLDPAAVLRARVLPPSPGLASRRLLPALPRPDPSR